jgi:hypothetical protein
MILSIDPEARVIAVFLPDVAQPAHPFHELGRHPSRLPAVDSSLWGDRLGPPPVGSPTIVAHT